MNQSLNKYLASAPGKIKGRESINLVIFNRLIYVVIMNPDDYKPPKYTGKDIGYWRVSTPEQEPGYQIDLLQKAGIPDSLIYGEKLTGAKMSRPELELAFKLARRGDCIVVWKLDRLGRSLKDVLFTVDELAERGINVRSLTEPVDTTSPMGRLMMQILLAVAEMERNLISERTKTSMAYKRKQDPNWKPGRKHSITGYPKRVKWLKEVMASGQLAEMTGLEVIAALNKADKKAPKINVPQVWYNFRKQGLPGIGIPEKDDEA